MNYDSALTNVYISIVEDLPVKVQVLYDLNSVEEWINWKPISDQSQL